jgi:hypothetical protein
MARDGENRVGTQLGREREVKEVTQALGRTKQGARKAVRREDGTEPALTQAALRGVQLTLPKD